ncbi:type II toxin-antitoxin system HipA family toxin [Lacimicrobium alkaliphilum]|uniref:Phosphatidylinositol kinase n=1 Tax=Lacimicrobium alkaliphilum TaxID=1526571 RepID=A0ABQ1RMV1_9ALTE|nr:HipA domain-containing protein [Lacimicrobium alkaliphilum]GGD75263.1 phosphatidylinositol kinase [Lacimicrobium alkaliphilum]
MTSEAYVYIDGIEDQPLICGIVALNHNNTVAQFRYGKSYLNHAKAFAIDPVNLPLSEDVFVTRRHGGMFGALLDAGADAWGKKLILSLHKTKPQNTIEFLLSGSAMGVGAITLSLSRNSCKPKRSLARIGQINDLLRGKNAILNDQAVSPEAKKAFQHGESMGGARPKAVVNDGEREYLVKFNRKDDLFNHARVEHASMLLLRELTDNVANTKTLRVDDEDVLLVERFDRRGSIPSCAFISARTLLDIDVVNPGLAASTYTYGEIADFLRRESDRASDSKELFTRMCFNALIGNTDDHVRNHGLIMPFGSRGWHLSPAYDVLPISSSRQHGLGLGNFGREATVENLLSQHRRFGLSVAKAKSIFNDVSDVTLTWPEAFSASGVTDEDIERLRGVIPVPSNLF